MLRHHKIQSCWLLALRPQCQRLKTKAFTQKLEYLAPHKWGRKHQLWRELNCRTYTVRANLQRNRSRHTPNSCRCLCRHRPQSRFKCRIYLTSNSVKPWAKPNNLTTKVLLNQKRRMKLLLLLMKEPSKWTTVVLALANRPRILNPWTMEALDRRRKWMKHLQNRWIMGALVNLNKLRISKNKRHLKFWIMAVSVTRKKAMMMSSPNRWTMADSGKKKKKVPAPNWTTAASDKRKKNLNLS